MTKPLMTHEMSLITPNVYSRPPAFDRPSTFPVLSRYQPEIKPRKEKNLLSSSDEAESGIEDSSSVRVLKSSEPPLKFPFQSESVAISYWHSVSLYLDLLSPHPTYTESNASAYIGLWWTTVSKATTACSPMYVTFWSCMPEWIISPDVSVVPGIRDSSGTKGLYYPVVFPNDFWMVICSS